MRKFTTTECVDFLKAIDAELLGPCDVVLIGGGAVALKYKGTHATTDLDLWSVSSTPSLNALESVHADNGFWEAVARAKLKAQVSVPVQKAVIAEPPYSFEDRLLTVAIVGLTKLRVFVPEAHDLVLMKIARGEAHDLDAVEDIHHASPLDLDTLVTRYRETTSQVMGSIELHRLNFLSAIARVFGEAAAERVDRETAATRKK